LPALLEAAKAAELRVREWESPRPLPADEAAALREAIAAALVELELAVRQARSLCDAAFARTPKAVAELGLDAKPKRRAARTSEAPNPVSDAPAVS
jgi:hypothetical protein